jgi:hypothetical protein
MEEKKLNTVYDFELADGEKVQMTLRYFSLYQLRGKNKTAYEKYNKIMIKGPQEELENVTILYTAYLCANLANIETCMTELEFLQRMPDDREYVGDILQKLINSKQK